jgi:hypothetical protein
MSVPYSSFRPPAIGSLSNVKINNNTLATGDVVKYNSANQLWENSPDGGNAQTADITDTNTDATYYPVFTDGAGTGKTLNVDVGTTPISVNPNSGDFNVVDTLKLDQNKVALGKSAGLTSQGNNAVAVGVNAGNSGQLANAVAVGNSAGLISQGTYAVAVGTSAGYTGQLGSAVAVGVNAGYTGQLASAVAVGNLAGQTSQGASAVAVGVNAGNSNQLANAVAVGNSAGKTSQASNSVAVGVNAGNSNQLGSAVAVGNSAGRTSQGANAVAVGDSAGYTGQHANSIILNASGVALNSDGASRLFIDPIRALTNPAGAGISGSLWYNSGSKEICYEP